MVKKNDKKEKKEVASTISAATLQICKDYGKDAIMMASNTSLEIIKFPTGIIGLDVLTGGGLPQARWSMLWGNKSAGKTSLCYHIIAKMQEAGKKCLLIDAEHGFDADYALSFGIDLDTLMVNRPNTLEEAITIVKTYAPLLDCIVLDSIVSVTTEQEAAKEMNQETMAVIPKKLAQFFRITNPIVGKSKAVVILINQTRTHLGGYVSYEDFPGGHALRHFCGFIAKISRGSKDDDPTEEIDSLTEKDKEGKPKKETVAIAHRTILTVDKSKISATEGHKAYFDLYLDVPKVNEGSDLLLNAEISGIVQRVKGGYSWKDKLYRKADFIDQLNNDEKLYKSLIDDLNGVEKNDDSKKTSDKE